MTIQSESIPLPTTLRTILQSIISLAGVIYAIGFIIVNSHYAQFGIVDYQLIQTRYVAAGINYLFIHLGVAVAIAMAVYLLGEAPRIVWIFSFLITWILFATVTYALSTSVIAAIATLPNAVVMNLIGYQILCQWKGTGQKLDHFTLGGEELPQRSVVILLAIAFAMLGALSAMTWGSSFWPVTSSILGGGRPNEGIFIFKTGDLPPEGLPFLHMQSDSVSAQLPILLESPDEYTVLVNLATAESPANLVSVRISRSVIVSVVYAPSGLMGKRQTLPPIPPSKISTPVPKQ